MASSRSRRSNLAVALLSQDGGVPARVVRRRASRPPRSLAAAAAGDREDAARVRRRRAGGQVYISSRVNEVFNNAEGEAQRMKASS